MAGAVSAVFYVLDDLAVQLRWVVFGGLGQLGGVLCCVELLDVAVGVNCQGLSFLFVGENFFILFLTRLEMR